MSGGTHGGIVLGLEDGATPPPPPQTCTNATPLAYGADNLLSNTITRYLSPVGDYSGGAAGTIPLPYIIQAGGAIARFQIRVETGLGNGNTIQYEVMALIAGVPTSLALPMIISLASTFTGVAAIQVPIPNVIADGDQIVVEVRKAAAVGQSPSCVQAFLQIENECGGVPGTACCAPMYLSQAMHQAYAFIYTTGQSSISIDLDTSSCGQNAPLSAVIRTSKLFPLATPPTVTTIVLDFPERLARVLFDASGAEDGNFVLEITNECGCCFLIPLEGTSA